MDSNTIELLEKIKDSDNFEFGEINEKQFILIHAEQTICLVSNGPFSFDIYKMLGGLRFYSRPTGGCFMDNELREHMFRHILGLVVEGTLIEDKELYANILFEGADYITPFCVIKDLAPNY